MVFCCSFCLACSSLRCCVSWLISDCDAALALIGISAVMSETIKINASSTQMTDRTTLRFIFI